MLVAELIYASDHDVNSSPLWRVERHPAGLANPWLVRFVKRGRNGKLLDQCALWTKRGWDKQRWMPRPPQVPIWLLTKVETHMCIWGDRNV